MKKKSIALHVYKLTCGYLAVQAQLVHDNLAVSAIYVAPPVSLADQQAAITNLRNAVDLWGRKGNRGSHQSWVELINSRDAVRDILKKLAQYCMTVTPNDDSEWIKIGFVTSRSRTPAAVPPQPRNFRQIISANVPALFIKLKWSRPFGVLPRETIFYNVMRSATTDFANAEKLATVSKTGYTDTTAGGTIWYYRIVPVNSAGAGVASSDLGAMARLIG